DYYCDSWDSGGTIRVF
nr:immunoglobulin light chain junction region [Macaca mulatta]